MRTPAVLVLAALCGQSACLSVPLANRPCGDGDACLDRFTCIDGLCLPVDDAVDGPVRDAGSGPPSDVDEDGGADADADAGIEADGGIEDAGIEADAGGEGEGEGEGECLPYGTSTTGVASDREAPDALYLFDEGTGAIVRDRSGRVPALDLVIDAPAFTEWEPDGLRTIKQGASDDRTLITTSGPPVRLLDACEASDAFTIEAWVVPELTSLTGPDLCVGITSGIDENEASITQGGSSDGSLDRFESRVRTAATDADGDRLFTANGTADAALTHLVFTFTGSQSLSRVFINGEVAVSSTSTGGGLGVWRNDALLSLGADFDGTTDGARHWFGLYRLVAVYCRGMGTAEIQLHHAEGPVLDGTPWCAP